MLMSTPSNQIDPALSASEWWCGSVQASELVAFDCVLMHRLGRAGVVSQNHKIKYEKYATETT